MGLKFKGGRGDTPFMSSIFLFSTDLWAMSNKTRW